MTRLGTFSAKQKETDWNEKAPSDGWRGCALQAAEGSYSARDPEPAMKRAMGVRQPAMSGFAYMGAH